MPMKVAVEGQYFLSIDIPGVDQSALEESEFERLVMVEVANNKPPTFELVFMTSKDDVVKSQVS